jgi:hypothetical protein
MKVFYEHYDEYIIGGIIIAFTVSIMPNNKLDVSEIWLIGLITSSTYAILDLLSNTEKINVEKICGLKEGFRI